MSNASTWDSMDLRIIRSLPDDIKHALTDQQMAKLISAVKPVPTKHGIALRASFRGPERRYYVALFCGEDQRNMERLKAEGQVDAIPVGITFFILLGLVALYGLVPLVIIGYLLKSMLGIDFFEGPSMFHAMVCG